MLVGVPRIADYIGRDEHSTRLMLEQGQLDGFWLSGRWMARPDTLDRQFEQAEQEQRERGAARSKRPIGRWLKRPADAQENGAEVAAAETKPPSRPPLGRSASRRRPAGRRKGGSDAAQP
jgi:hypothetical protein